MPRILLIYIFATLCLVISSCKSEPTPINYSEDQCYACKMMISDQRFGAELVTTKGKIYKFDAAECMIEMINKSNVNDYEYMMVTHFNSPNVLKDASNSYFIVSPDRPSPMGANLSAYGSEAEAQAVQKSIGGEILNWERALKNVDLK
jgi:copper chaperone NosL